MHLGPHLESGGEHGGLERGQRGVELRRDEAEVRLLHAELVVELERLGVGVQVGS